jgi:selenocysteine lyase/cysteine desulfurase
MLCVALESYYRSVSDIGTELQRRGIDVSVRRGIIRVSPYVYNTVADVTKLVETLQNIVSAPAGTPLSRL